MTEKTPISERREEFDTLFDVKHEHEGVCMTFSSKNPSREDIFKWILKECVFKDDVRRVAEETIQEERFYGAPNGINKVVENLGLKPLERRRNRENK